jgi:ankyrin repeat protein
MFDINIRDEQNNYFLTYAVTLNQPSIVKFLIDNGAKIDIVDKYDRSILAIPITYSYNEILEILLEGNKSNIGISITDIKDKNLRIPLHYAIEVQNVNAIEILLKYGSNPNIIDKDGCNSLHLAVKSRSLAICEMILNYIGDINSRYNTGETALHISCNLQLIEISRLLIKNGINVNAQDYSHEITALHYSVLLNNKELIALLLKHNAEPNIQDIYGNTALHYCIIESNFEIFLMLTQSSSTKNIINLNMWNIDGEIPLHLVLKKNDDTIVDYLDIMIEKSNLSLQDNDGNTCLHYLIKMNIWINYKSFLIKKRLDIFAMNTSKIMPIDLVKTGEYDEFIDVIIDSYIYRLRTANELWYNEWENICSKYFDKVEDKDIKILSQLNNVKVNNITSFETSCKSIIKKKNN